MNSRINFEVADLLDKKGYPFQFATIGGVKGVPINIPTISDVVMWLHDKHGIWISVFNDDVNFFWMGIILETKERLRDGNAREFYSPTEAYLEGIKYVLENLIEINLVD